MTLNDLNTQFNGWSHDKLFNAHAGSAVTAVAKYRNHVNWHQQHFRKVLSKLK